MDDSDARDFLETVHREAPLDLESVIYVSRICGEQRYQCGYGGIVHSTSILGTTPCIITLMHGGCVSSQTEVVQTMVD